MDERTNERTNERTIVLSDIIVLDSAQSKIVDKRFKKTLIPIVI
jgi:hypothetical protein